MKAEERKRERLGNEIAGLMGPLVRELRSAFTSCATELQLAPAEAQAVWVLELRGPTTTKDLAARLDIDPANASTLVTKLERRGLIARETAPDDRRRRLVSLTAEGSGARERLADCVARRRPAFTGLTTVELETFRDLLARL